MAKLSPTQIKTALPKVPAWKKKRAAMKFVNRVARAAEAAAHHPDVDIRWNKVTLTLATHSEGGLTRKDFALAQQIDDLAGR